MYCSLDKGLKGLKVSDFYYHLPESLIAQKPLDQRDMSRLMVLHKERGEVTHRIFKDIVDYFEPGDCLVLNNTRVIPARLIGQRKDTGGKMEFVLLKPVDKDRWEVLVKPGRRAKTGSEFVFGEGELTAKILENTVAGGRVIEFKYQGVFEEVLDRLGKIPLPPYIKEKLEDKERYQTVYSKEEGSAAAPTAGLHFTRKLMDEIELKGVKIVYITLHVGLGTFRPVKAERIEEHQMHAEYYRVDGDAAQIINSTLDNGGRIVAAGTTACRTLETVAQDHRRVKEGEGWTDIFIYPGHKFKAVDGLITNFHLPESTLVMLVSAFAGKDNIMKAYATAVEERYRFFSFGDAMLII